MYVYYGIVQWMEWAEFADGVHFYAIPVSTCTKLFLHAGEGGGRLLSTLEYVSIMLNDTSSF